MADRIIGMRTALRENLEKLGSPLPWKHVTEQVRRLLENILNSNCCALLFYASLITNVIVQTDWYVLLQWHDT